VTGGAILVAHPGRFGRGHFPPLHAFAAANAIRIVSAKSRSVWLDRDDAYRGLAHRLAPHIACLRSREAAGLATHLYRGIGVFACARAEIVRALMPRWAEPWPQTDQEIAESAFAEPGDQDTLLLGMAAARDWIDFWHRSFDREDYFCCAVASDDRALHNRTLLEVALRRRIPAVIATRFATGRHYIFDAWRPAVEPPSAAGRDWDERFALGCDPTLRSRARAEAHRQLAPIRASVAARPASEVLTPPWFGAIADFAAIAAQPVNEPSPLDCPQPLIGPEVYRRLVLGILDRTELGVVLLIEASPIARRVGEWRETLPAMQRARLIIAPAAPLEVVLSQAALVVSLSASWTLQACRAGLKPVRFGAAPLAGKNFTHDFAGPDAFLAALEAGAIDGSLTLAEYRAFEDFLAQLMLLYLVPDGDRGAGEIAARLAEPDRVRRLAESDLTAAATRPTWPSPAAALANPTAALRLARSFNLTEQD
jgi:hypothetical protein